MDMTAVQCTHARNMLLKLQARGSISIQHRISKYCAWFVFTFCV